MAMKSFYHSLKYTLKNYHECERLLSYLDKINANNNISHILKMTRMTILFEGFYIASDVKWQKLLLPIRLKRWRTHYGTPTINFLLTYQFAIKETKAIFTNEINDNQPWDIMASVDLIADNKNEILVNRHAISNIETPKPEVTGQLTKTYNTHGGFTTTPCDPISEAFIYYANTLTQGNVLEIGAGFGAATLEVLTNGVAIFCNDIEAKNLAVVHNRFFKKNVSQKNNANCDSNQLILLPGAFPDELVLLPANYFDAILICRVLHFLTGDKIETSLSQLHRFLKPNGKLFIVCETPFSKRWQRFIPEYEKRVEKGIKWPGEVINPVDFEENEGELILPSFMHWMTKEILERCLKEATFKIDEVTYINRKNMFPDNWLLDGRESIGAIATKSK